jgi:hypothetical protein
LKKRTLRPSARDVPNAKAKAFAHFVLAAAAGATSLPESRQGSIANLATSLARVVAAPLQSRTITMQTTSQFVVRDPDGVPHEIVGLTWLFSIIVAIVSFAALISGGALAALTLLMVPIAIVALERRARQRRAVRHRATKSEIRSEIAGWRGL